MQILLEISDNFIVIKSGQSETSLRLTQGDMLNQVVGENDLASEQCVFVSLLFAVGTSRFVGATTLDWGAEIVDTRDGAEVIGKIIGRMIRNISKEEGDGVS